MMLHKKLTFHDASQFSKTIFTNDGFLKTEALITKVGVYQYKLANGNKVNVFKSPKEIFSDATMESMKMLPITNGHPPTDTRLINSKTAKTFSVGFLGETIKNENNEYLRATMVITDQKTIDDITKKGKKQLSAGYTGELIEESGIFNGQQYTHVQKSIRGNHVAVVEKGRVGADVAIVLDGADAVMIDIVDAVQILNNEEQEIMSQNLKMVMLDNIEYQASPEVANALSKIQEDISKVQKELSDVKVMLDSKTAECDALKQSNYELSSKDVTKEIEECAKKRVTLLNTVRNVFGDSVAEKVLTFNDHDIKIEVLQPMYKDIELKKKSAEYIDAMFDTTISCKKDEKMSKQRARLAIMDSRVADGKSVNKKSFGDRFNVRGK